MPKFAQITKHFPEGISHGCPYEDTKTFIFHEF